MSFDILVIGDAETKGAVEQVFTEGKSRINITSAIKRPLETVEQERFDLLVLQFENPAIKPLKLLGELYTEHKETKVLVSADSPSIDEVVKCMKLGAIDVVTCEGDRSQLKETLTEVHSKWMAGNEASQYHDGQQHQFGPGAIIGESAEMMQILKVLKKVAKRRWVTVLIQGETGTGKEVIARAIHYNTAKEGPEPFVEINCSAIPENLLEAELFGYEKGAFTDAKARKRGLIEMAEGGTLFLDEIGDMSPALQAKLLKAIEEKKVRRLGGTADIEVKTRIVSGTNADLQSLIEEGNFRRDLYYRLNVVNLHLPPLRERGDDTILLAQYFLKKFTEEYEIPKKSFAPEAIQALAEYDWPGNVRELQHVVERTVLLGEESVISGDEIMAALGVKSKQQVEKVKKDSFGQIIEIPRNGMTLKEGEQRLIEEILNITKWNKTKASQILGISRPRLNRKIEEYRIGM